MRDSWFLMGWRSRAERRLSLMMEALLPSWIMMRLLESIKFWIECSMRQWIYSCCQSLSSLQLTLLKSSYKWFRFVASNLLVVPKQTLRVLKICGSSATATRESIRIRRSTSIQYRPGCCLNLAEFIIVSWSWLASSICNNPDELVL